MPRRSLLTALLLLSLSSSAQARPVPADPPLPAAPPRAEVRNPSHRDEAGVAALLGVAVLAAATARRRRSAAA